MPKSPSSPALSSSQKIIWIGLFGLTMGYFEAAVVEYLRTHLYPEGFAFPLKEMPVRLLLVELGREAASIFMLLAVGWIGGRGFLDRFAGFMFGFGVWDITYYLWLKLFENWPGSLNTNDLLFLLPFPWVGPVWAPVGISVGLIWAAAMYWNALDLGKAPLLTKWEWFGETVAGLILIGSFLTGAPAAIQKQPLPPYLWWLWVIGMTTGIAIFWRAIRRGQRSAESS